MAKCHDFVHDIKYDRVFHHAVIVEFAKVLDFCNSPLIEFIIVLLKANCDVFNQVIDDTDHKFRVVPMKGADEDGKKMDVTIFNFPWLRKDLFKHSNNLRD